MAVEVEVKKWGNSMAVILPKSFVEARKIRENDKIHIEVIKPVDFSDCFGMLKGKTKMTGQQFKDMVRKGWD